AVLVEANFDAAVLWQALFSDVKLRHDLDSRGNGIAELHGRAHDVVKDAVDAVADSQLLLVGLDVNIAGALLYPRHHDAVGQPNAWRFLPPFRQRLGADFLELLENLDVPGFFERLELFKTFGRQLEGAWPGRLFHDRLASRRRVVAFERLGNGDLGCHDRL